MTTDGVSIADVNSLNDHIDTLEGAIHWCINNRAVVSFHVSGNVVVEYIRGKRITGTDFLDAIEKAKESQRSKP